MPEQLTNEDVVRRYVEASVAADIEALGGLRDPDWMVDWPQSGERVHGHRSYAEIIRHYPGGAPTVEIRRVVGAEDRWVVTPSNTIARVAGSGDFWWTEWLLSYPDGSSYLVVGLLELRSSRIHRETVYWAAPFDAPDWRSPWVDPARGGAPGR
jgi:hypothetical protein